MTLTKSDYTPKEWNDAQRTMHEPATLDQSFHNASCLAGGWYRRPVTIAYRIVPPAAGERYASELYRLHPSDAPTPDGFEPIYRIEAVGR